MFYTYIEIGESTSEGVEEKKCFTVFVTPASISSKQIPQNFYLKEVLY